MSGFSSLIWIFCLSGFSLPKGRGVGKVMIWGSEIRCRLIRLSLSVEDAKE